MTELGLESRSPDAQPGLVPLPLSLWPCPTPYSSVVVMSPNLIFLQTIFLNPKSAYLSVYWISPFVLHRALNLNYVQN